MNALVVRTASITARLYISRVVCAPKPRSPMYAWDVRSPRPVGGPRCPHHDAGLRIGAAYARRGLGARSLAAGGPGRTSGAGRVPVTGPRRKTLGSTFP